MTSSKYPLLVYNRATAPMLAASADSHVVRVHVDAGLHATYNATNSVGAERPGDVVVIVSFGEY